MFRGRLRWDGREQESRRVMTELLIILQRHFSSIGLSKQ